MLGSSARGSLCGRQARKSMPALDRDNAPRFKLDNNRCSSSAAREPTCVGQNHVVGQSLEP